MKKQIWIFIYCIFAYIFIGCNSNKKEEIISHDYTIKIDLKNSSQLNIEDIAVFHSLVPLETSDDIIIGKIGQIFLTDSLIIIRDSQTGDIPVFGYDGNFKYKIGKKGQGPEEYVKNYNIFVDKYQNIISVSDMATRRIITYDLQGNFLDSKKVDFFMYNFIPYQSGYWSVNGGQNREKYDLIYTNKDNQIEQGYFPINSEAPLIFTNNFYNNNGEFMYHSPYSDYLYKISKNKVKPYIYVDFGKKKRKYTSNMDANNIAALIKSSDYMGRIQNVFFHNDKVFFTFYDFFAESRMLKAYYCYAILNQPDVEPVIYDHKINYSEEVFISPNPEILNISESKIIFQIEPNVWNENTYEKLKGSKYENLFNSESNPILVLYEIKD
jgi:hypothetical protein